MPFIRLLLAACLLASTFAFAAKTQALHLTPHPTNF